MNYVNIGKLVNTHGIKGEIRILSDFDKKELVFKSGFKLYIGENKECVTIKSYRPHKNFDMCVFKEYHYINDVLKFKGKNVYVNRDDLELKGEEYLESDLIGVSTFYQDNMVGKLVDIINNNGYKLILLDNGKYIPYNKEFISKVDVVNKKLEFKNLEGII